MGKEDKKPDFRVIIRFIAAISAFLAVFCLTLPSARKKNAVEVTGNTAIEAMSAVSTAISYYSAETIEKLAETPKLDSDYKYIAGLLAQLTARQSYEKMYILSCSENKSLCYLIDGSYRDNGRAGSDYFAPAAPYQTENGYKTVKSLTDKIYSGKLTNGYANELVTDNNGKSLVVSCLPIYGAGNTVAAILCIESDPGNTAFNMIGGINLYAVGGCSAAITAVCFAFFIVRRKFTAWRQQRRCEKDLQQADFASTECSDASHPESESDFSCETDREDTI